MSANGLYNPDQSAVNTRWIEPWTEAFRVSVSCTCCVECPARCVLGVGFHRVNALLFWKYADVRECLADRS